MAHKADTPQVSHHHDAEEAEEQSYPNPFPALPVFNNPVYTKEFEESVKSEHSLPLDTWHTSESVREPPAAKLGPIYESRREAWKATGWVHCKDFLGQGGFGKVYLGFQYEDRHSNTPLISRKLCAIKEVHISYDSLERMEPGVAAEAYILRAVSHPNIVRLFACYSIPSNRRFYFVMEFADGKDLHYEIFNYATTSGPMPLEENYCRALFIGIVGGMAYLHARGVGHRDIKPENILMRISADGQTKVPKIADFGLSTIYVGKENADGTRQQFIERYVCGTTSYMAPEMMFKAKNLTRRDVMLMQNNPVVWRRPIPVSNVDFRYKLDDERNKYNGEHRRPMCEFTDEYKNGFYRPPQVDVYALGVTLYMMLTGDLPYNLRDQNVFVHFFRCEPMRAKWILTQPTFDFICLMLEPDPSKRLTIQQIRDHEWMKGPIAGPAQAVTRSLPADKYAVYSSPSSSGPSSARPADTAAAHLLDQLNFNPLDIEGSAWDRLMRQMHQSSSQKGSKSSSSSTWLMRMDSQAKKPSGSTWDAMSGAAGGAAAAPQQPPKKSSGSTWDDTSGMLEASINPRAGGRRSSSFGARAAAPQQPPKMSSGSTWDDTSGMLEAPIAGHLATGRGQAPQKMGALLNAFGNLALHPGADMRQRSRSLAARPVAPTPLLRTRSSSLDASPRARQASAGPADAPQKQESKPIISSLKDMASRVASKVTGAKSATVPPSPRSGSSGSSSGGGRKKKKGRRSN